MIDPYHIRCRYQYKTPNLVVKFDLQLYKLGNNSYLVDFKNVGSNKDPNRMDETLNKVKEQVERMHLEKQQDDEQLPIWMRNGDSIQDDHGEKILSVYPFLDVCSKVITDIV